MIYNTIYQRLKIKVLKNHLHIWNSGKIITWGATDWYNCYFFLIVLHPSLSFPLALFLVAPCVQCLFYSFLSLIGIIIYSESYLFYFQRSLRIVSLFMYRFLLLDLSVEYLHFLFIYLFVVSQFCLSLSFSLS